MLQLLTNCRVYAPEDRGEVDVLWVNEHVLKVERIDQKALAHVPLEVEIVDCKGGIVIPGLVDPHEHLLGGSGENGGFSTQTPELTLTELTKAGITTVVGTLGVDTYMKTMDGLLAKAKGLRDEGLCAYLFTGGYTVPPTTIMKDVRLDIMFLEEVIGLGELAIADHRADDPKPSHLARHVIDAHVGGMLANKAGVTHFHVGNGRRKLQCLVDLMEYHPEVEAEWLYPTHIERSAELIAKAVAFTKKGSTVDMDVADGHIARWLQVYRKEGGTLDKLTLSSDASKTSARLLFDTFRSLVRDHGYSMEDALPLVTRNAARVLKLEDQGRIKVGGLASFVVLDQDDLEIRHVFSRGHCMIRDGAVEKRERFLKDSDRVIDLRGYDAD